MTAHAVRWAQGQVAGSAMAKSVLLTIAGFADQDGFAWAARGTLSAITEMSVRSVQRAIKHLIEADLIASPDSQFRFHSGLPA